MMDWSSLDWSQNLLEPKCNNLKKNKKTIRSLLNNFEKRLVNVGASDRSKVVLGGPGKVVKKTGKKL